MPNLKKLDLSGFDEEMVAHEAAPSSSEGLDLSGFDEEMAGHKEPTIWNSPVSETLGKVGNAVSDAASRAKDVLTSGHYGQDVLDATKALGEKAGSAIMHPLDTLNAGLYGASNVFMGGQRDKVLAGLESAAGGQDYQGALDWYRQYAKEKEQESPIASTAGTMAAFGVLPGMSIGSAAPLEAGVGGLSKLVNLASTGARQVPAAMALGVAEKAGSSDNALEVPLSEYADAAKIAGAGTLLGPAALHYGAEAVKGVGKSLSSLGTAAKNLAFSSRGVEQGAKFRQASKEGFDPYLPGASEKLSGETISTFKEPSLLGQQKVQQEIIDPANKQLYKTSEDINSQLSKVTEAEQQWIERQKLNAAKDLGQKVGKLKGEADTLIRKVQTDLSKAGTSEEQQLIVRDFVEELKRIQNIQGRALQNSDEISKIVESYENAIYKAPDEVKRLRTITQKYGKDGEPLAPLETEVFKQKGDVSAQNLKTTFQDADEIRRVEAQKTIKPDSTSVKETDIAELPRELREDISPDILWEAQDSSGKKASDLAKRGFGSESAAVGEARRSVIVPGRKALVESRLGPTMVDEFEKAKLMSHKAMLLEETHGIDLRDPESARTTIANKMKAIMDSDAPAADKIASAQSFGKDLASIDPALEEQAQITFAKLGEEASKIKQAPSVDNIQTALESQKFNPVTGQILAKAEGNLPKGHIEDLASQGRAQAKIAEEGRKTLENLDYTRILSDIKGINNPANLKSIDSVNEWLEAYGKVDAQAAKDLRNNMPKLLNKLEVAALHSNAIGNSVGTRTRAGRYVGSKLGSAENKAADIWKSVLPKLEGATPASFQNWMFKAQQSGKPRVAKYLENLQSKDTITRNSTLFMISQQQGIKQDLSDIVNEDETPEGQ